MFRILAYLKKSLPTVLIIIILLFIEANCELAIPDYTANIVNVGIQQKGYESSLPEAIRRSKLEELLIFLSADEQVLVRDSYRLDYTAYNAVEEEIYLLKDSVKKDSELSGELESILSTPQLIMSFASNSELGESAEYKDAMASGKIDEIPEMIISQAAINYTIQEYEAIGVDLEASQNRYIFNAGLIMIGVTLLSAFCAVLVSLLAARCAALLGMNLRGEVFDRVIDFSNKEFDKFSTASLITRSTNDIQQVQMFTVMMLRMVIYSPILGIGGFIRVIGSNASMAWLIGLAVTVIMIIVGTLFAFVMPKFKKMQTLIDKLNRVTREILTGIPVIRAFNTEVHEEKRFDKTNRDLTSVNIFVNRTMSIMMPVMMLLMNAVSIVIVWQGAHNIDSGTMQVGDLLKFISYAMQIIMSFLMLSMISIMYPRASVSAKRIREVIECDISIHDPEEPNYLSPSNGATLEFRDVSFRYPGAEEDVLSNISFAARPGETTAIIGSTGSGKSTVVSLIPRFYDVTEGKILINNVDIRDLPQRILRDQLGYVPQQGILFSGTIETNIKYGAPTASLEQMERAARIAQAYDFIDSKPDRFDDPIAQGGSNVSGGQKQRLSIARAIAKNPNIYIFDDSFSALDYKTDIALRSALKEETKGATVIIVAQRINTILHANQIIVLDDGNIAGIGTHKELLRDCPVYLQIASSQLSKEELENV